MDAKHKIRGLFCGYHSLSLHYPWRERGKVVPVQGGGSCGSGEMRGEDVNHRLGQQDRDSPGKPSRCVLVNSRPIGWKSYA